MSESLRIQKIAMGFDEAARTVGVSKRFLQYATNDPDPAKRLRTVRVASRRLIRASDLEDWFRRVSVEEPQAA
jgi:hypothetical protein